MFFDFQVGINSFVVVFETSENRQILLETGPICKKTAFPLTRSKKI